MPVLAIANVNRVAASAVHSIRNQRLSRPTDPDR
jgi:hypothetical protein